MSSMSSRPALSRWTAGIFTFVLAVLSLAACGAAKEVATPFASSTSAGSGDPALTSDAPATPPGTELTIADGFIPEGGWLSPFDSDHPAIANLDPRLRAAIQQAAHDARAEGVEIVITSAWRSAAYQQALLDEAIALYGSVDEARRWVNTPERSTHVTGDAVDTGPWDANLWLSQCGYAYGLCQTYANEPWHFELAVTPGDHCPEPLSDASVG